MQNSVRILAIDPGYERLGVAILERDTFGAEALLYSDCFKTPQEKKFSERIHMLGSEVSRLITLYKPTAVALETLFLTKNQKTAMLVAETRGVFIYEAEKHSLLIFEYSPLQIKIAVTGYGKSDKEQVTAMVRQLIKVEKDIKHDDEFDAIAIGLTCFASEKLV